MSDRMDKVNALVGAELSRALAPIQPAHSMATVTRVETSPDLNEARVWISLLPDTDTAWEALEERLPDLQAALAERLVIKRTPKLRLVRDHSGEHAQKIDRLLKEDS
jgi:ribosome-binding factor A